MSILDVVSRNFSLGPPNSSFGFERAYAAIQVGITQPEQSGHRSSVMEERRIANHDRRTARVAYNDDEIATRLAPEEASYCREIRLEGLLFGQGRFSDDGEGATAIR